MNREHNPAVDTSQARRDGATELPPPCPWWCASTVPDHKTDYDSQSVHDEHELHRYHSRSFGNSVAAVVQDETNRHGRVTLGAARISIYDDEATPDDAQAKAAAIQGAVDLLARITADDGLAVWQSAPCPSWCISRSTGGHWDGEAKSDRWHLSEWTTMDRPTLTAVETVEGWRVRRTGVRLEQNANPHASGLCFVRISTEDDEGEFPAFHDTSWPLITTAVEALDLAEMVRSVACMAANETLPAPLEVS